jgi:transcription elongation GreA/GreB family factor
MNTQERAQFIDSIAEAAHLLGRAQAALQRARTHCHAEIFEQVDLISKRLYEAKVTSEWLRQGVLGRLDLNRGQAAAGARACVDRRQSVDRRIAGMREQIREAAAIVPPKPAPVQASVVRRVPAAAPQRAGSWFDLGFLAAKCGA